MTGWASLPARTWTCGHPRSPGNTQSIGGGGRIACKTCRRRIARESKARRYFHKRGPRLQPQHQEAQ